MRTFDSATNTYIASETNIVARILLWITAKDRTTGADQTIGVWNGDDHTDFTINGGTRTYYGAGSVLSFPDIIYRTGFLVQTHTVELSPLAPEVAQAIRGYEPRFAPVEMHRALFDSATGVLVSEPARIFRGWIDDISLPTPEIGGSSTCSITLASAARALTRSVAQMKSDATQKLRSGDRFRKWNAVSGSVEVSWGEARGKIGSNDGGGGGTDKRDSSGRSPSDYGYGVFDYQR